MAVSGEGGLWVGRREAGGRELAEKWKLNEESLQMGRWRCGKADMVVGKDRQTQTQTD